MDKEDYNKSYKKSYKKLVRRMIVALLLLLVVFLFKQFGTQYQISQEMNASHILNIAGRQRMLSQKIAKDMLLINKEHLSVENDPYIKSLENSLELWKQSHEELLTLNKADRFFRKESSSIPQMFRDIEPSYLEIVHGVEGFLKQIKNGDNGVERLNTYISKVIDNEAVFLEQMDAIVSHYERQMRKSLMAIQTGHMVLFIIIIILLSFILFKIFIPLLKYLDQAFLRVSESNDNLIRIFRTMKGALIVIKKDGEIIFMNRDAEKVVSKEKGSNEPLYLQTNIDWGPLDIVALIDQVKNDNIRLEDVETTIKDKGGNLVYVVISAVSGVYYGHEAIVLNLYDMTSQKKAEELLKNTALKDELTGLYNRRFLENIIEGELERTQRYDVPLSAALLDLDYFKGINDQWGHPVGDSVLKLAADILRQNIRKSDFPIRIGGEEFLILMPNTDAKGAIAKAEKVRRAIEDTRHPVIGNFTASLGVAERVAGEEYQYLYERIDEALYQAKKDGRNCVVLAENQSCDYLEVPTKWNSKWDCGEEKIDQQHQELFQAINHLVKSVESTGNKQTTIKELMAIKGAVIEHFEYEEKVLKQVKYRGLYSHTNIHELLVERTTQVIEALEKDELNPKEAVSIIFDEVIVGHLLCEDIKFYPYIEA